MFHVEQERWYTPHRPTGGAPLNRGAKGSQIRKVIINVEQGRICKGSHGDIEKYR